MPTGKYIRTDLHKKQFIENMNKWKENNRDKFIEIARKNRLSKPTIHCEKCGGFIGKNKHECIILPKQTPEQINKRILSRKESLLRGEWKPAKYWLNKKRDISTKNKISITAKENYKNGKRKLSPNIKKGVCLNTGRTQFKKGDNKGEKHYNWKNGITPKNKQRWCSAEYQKWRKAVFERDKYLCQNTNCKKTTKEINAHHIKQIYTNPELTYDIDNGKTLCVMCHKEIHKEMRNEVKNENNKR